MAKIQHKDHGKIISVDCPECRKNNSFHLWQEIDYSSFFLKMLGSFDKHTWSIKCESCDHAIPVPTEEAENIHVIQDAAAKRENNKISNDVYNGVLGQFSFVEELFHQVLAWDCSKCAERVTWNFQVCWNCHAPNPEFDGKGKSDNAKFVAPSCGFNVIQQ
jgi:hypothetical protein